jgi:hypothetical protein
MNKHYLAAPHKLTEGQSPLPDRTDLSKLYPNATQRSNAKREAEENSPSKLTNNIAEMIKRYAVVIGIVSPLPFLIGVVLIEYFIQHVYAGNIFIFLPIIAITAALWLALLALFYVKIARLLDQFSISPISFLGFHVGCLVLISQPLYSAFQLIDIDLLSQLLFSLSLIGISIVLAWIFLQLIISEKLSNRVRVSLGISIIVTCLFLAIAYLVIHPR